MAMIGSLAALALACAPNVHLTTLNALIGTESGRQPYAIGINGDTPIERQPQTREEAIVLAKTLMAKGTNFDAGLGQINVRNWAWLNLTPETVFDPCVNLQAAQTVLADCYTRASQQYADKQQALHAALSCYNTGHFERGFKNGYVGKVLAQAGIKIPELQAPTTQPSPTPENQSSSDQTPKPEPEAVQGDRDGFVSNPAQDGFSRQKDAQKSAPAF